MAPRFRGLPSLRTDPETGEALCVACGLCARICPTSCLEMHVVPSEEGDRELGEFILRAGRCMFCGLCAQVCPVDAITMSQEYELSVLDRDGLIYTKTELGHDRRPGRPPGGKPAVGSGIPTPSRPKAATSTRYRDVSSGDHWRPNLY